MRLELKLKEIHLQNFRLFDDLKVSFDEQLTVFISENGAGKTSLLEGIAKSLYAFAGVVDSTIEFSKATFFENIFKDTDIQYLKNQGVIDISTVIQQADKSASLSWHLDMRRNKRQSSYTLDKGSLKRLDALKTSLEDSSLDSLPVIMYYSSERAAKNSMPTRIPTQFNMYNSYDDALIGNTLNFNQFLKWYNWQTQIEIFSKTKNVILEQVKMAVLMMLNDAHETVFDDLYIDPTLFGNPRLMISKKGNKLEINQLSDGEKNLFLLMCDLTQRLCLANPLSKEPLKEGQGIVLIDEIDLHLHPRWQRKILTQLKSVFPNIQWVVTTHSPFVLAAEEVHPKNAYLLTDEIKPDGSTQKIAVSIEDLGKFNQGLEPNRILSEIMRVPLRNQATETEIQQLHQLLNSKDFEKPAFEQLFQQLSHKLGIHDPVMVRASHRISVLKRQKQNEVH